MAQVKRIDHIAVLVEDLETAVVFWHEVLGIEVGKRSEVAAEQAEVAFLLMGDSEIELVQPMGGESGLRRFLEKRGPGLHHVCLEVDDIEGMMARLKAHGVELINEVPRVGKDGKRYAFVHPRSTGGVLVEVYEGKDEG